jgi:hypothetical protein
MLLLQHMVVDERKSSRCSDAVCARVRGRTWSSWRPEASRTCACYSTLPLFFLAHSLVPSSFFFSWKHEDTVPGLHEKFSSRYYHIHIHIHITLSSYPSADVPPLCSCRIVSFQGRACMASNETQRRLLHLSKQGVQHFSKIPMRS